MKKNLRFLIAAQSAAFAVCLIFGFWVAMLRDLKPGDLKTIQSRVDAASEPDEWQKIGGSLVKVLEEKESRYRALRTTFLIFIGAFGFSALCNTLLAAAILQKFKWSGYDDPSVVMRSF